MQKDEQIVASIRVPVALRTRLGDDGVLGLFEVVDSTRRDWTADVLTLATDRFERRLAQEMAALRVEIAEGQTTLRREFHDGLAGVRKEVADARVELLRWSFLFWIGQVATTAGLLAYMLRNVAP